MFPRNSSEYIYERTNYKLTNHCIYIHLNKLISFLCPIITYEPQDRFASNFDWGTQDFFGFEIRS